MIVMKEQVLRLRYLVDDSGLKAFAQGFEATMASMRAAAVEAGAAIRRALQDALPPLPAQQAGGAWASPSQAGAQRQSTAAMQQHATALRGFRGAVTMLLGGSPLKRIATDIDAWSQTQARLQQVTGSAEETAEVDRDIARVARSSRTLYADSVDTYVRTRQTLQDHGRSGQDAAGLTEAVALGMRLSGTPAEARGEVVAALLRMIEQGKLGMAEYNALPRRIQQALGAGLALDPGQMRQAVQNGQVTVNRALPALQSQLPTMQAEVQAAPATLSGAMTVLNDAMQRYFGETLPGGQLALKALTGAIQLLADHIDTVVKLLALAGASMGLVALGNGLRQATVLSGGLLRSLLAATRVALGLDAAMALRSGPAGARQMLSVWTRSLAPMLRMAAVLTTIYWIGEDIAKWLSGGVSVLGGWIGGVEAWRDELDAVSGALTFVKDLLGGAGQSLGRWLSQFGAIAVMLYGMWQILSPVASLILTLARVGVPLLSQAFMFLATSVVPMLWNGLMGVATTVLSSLSSGLLFVTRSLIPMLWNAFAMTPIGRIITAITLLVVALWQIWENWDVIKAYIGESWDALMAMARDSFLGPVLEYFSAIWTFWKELVAGVIAAFTGDWDGAIAHWQGAFSGLWTFFSGMGGRMVATVKQIGSAIQTWVLDKVKAAKNLFMKLLPGGSDDEQASVMDKWSAPEDLPPEWLGIASGAMVPLVPPSIVFAPATGAGRAPLSYRNHNNVVVNVTGGDEQTVRAGVASGLTSASERGLNSFTQTFDVPPSVERTS